MQMREIWPTYFCHVTCARYSSVHHQINTTLVYNLNFKDLRSDGHARGENTASTGDYFAIIPSVARLHMP